MIGNYEELDTAPLWPGPADVTCRRCWRIARLLFGAGTDANARDVNGRTA